ncbi:hypothetical protein C4587_02795 [Candidatus Parcubacteria bacterium]|nr:MAG: hypothetical protein C4587_02795 [Candidatus Parcubacteria bacterium]
MDKETTKDQRLKAGHYEIQGETIAKFEFFDQGYNPYSRYLDIDKVDLILRRKEGKKTKYAEIQVKFGTLYPVGERWAKENFDYTSWRFFNPDEFKESHNLFIAYVLARREGYKGDIFIFSSEIFHKLINSSRTSNTKRGKRAKMYIAHCIHDDKWYLWKGWKFNEINNETTVDVSKYRRNFDLEV